MTDFANNSDSLANAHPRIILWGAGAAGGYALRHLRPQGIEPVAIVDSRSGKWGTTFPSSTLRDGIDIVVSSPEEALASYPDAEWVACAISRPAATEIREELKRMGVRTKPLWECLPVCHGLPPASADSVLRQLVADDESFLELVDQEEFRSNPDYDRQRPPSPIRDIYFPDFIQHRDDEHYIDCGAADGDTIAQFKSLWPRFRQITAFEPDEENQKKLRDATWQDLRVLRFWFAVSSHYHVTSFTSAGDYSSHLGEGSDRVQCVALDDLHGLHPTYIKMDIEGAELEALWGARRILKEHSPVLAVCAYHTSDHLWQIPLLLHAIQPEYSLHLRRYAEGAFELVWYAVPPGRVRC